MNLNCYDCGMSGLGQEDSGFSWSAFFGSIGDFAKSALPVYAQIRATKAQTELAKAQLEAEAARARYMAQSPFNLPLPQFPQPGYGPLEPYPQEQSILFPALLIGGAALVAYLILK